MRHQVMLFAGLRERANADCITVELGEHDCVRDLLATLAELYPQLAPGLAHCRVALDQEFAEADTPIGAAREIAIIPPVSGGHGPVRILLTRETLSLDAVFEQVRHAEAGGVALFIGTVRRHTGEREVEALDYEAYDAMAVRTLTAIADAIEAEIPHSCVAIHHRVGHLDVGELAVVVGASAPHRAEAFQACREAIERLKRDVPIWKKELSTDGQLWVGRGS